MVQLRIVRSWVNSLEISFRSDATVGSPGKKRFIATWQCLDSR